MYLSLLALALFILSRAVLVSARLDMSAGGEAGGLLDSLGVSAVDASAVEKDLWAQVGHELAMLVQQYCGL